MGLDHSADQNHLQSRNHPGQDETTYGSTIYHNAMGDYFLGFSDQHKEGLTAPKEKSVEHLNGEHSDHKSKKPHPPVGVPEKPPTEARPYVLELSPTDPNTHSAHCDPVMKERLNNFSKRVEDLAEHMKLGSSMSDTVKGKLNLGAEIVKKGGKENLFNEKFNCDGHEKLLKACACHLSTTTGPIGGLLFISNKKIAFCSDRSLIFTCPSGGIAWSYYRVSIPIGKIGSVSPCENVNKPAEKYIRIQTVDIFEFWFMGFVNIQKAYKYVHEALKK